METAIVWGWLLTAQAGNLPPIIDPNYASEADCLLVRSEFVALHPEYDPGTYCTPTWKPQAKPKVHRRAKR
jgi:hypothetical protein